MSQRCQITTPVNGLKNTLILLFARKSKAVSPQEIAQQENIDSMLLALALNEAPGGREMAYPQLGIRSRSA